MNNTSMIKKLTMGIMPIVVLSSSAFAQNFESVIDSTASSTSLDSSVVFDSSGTLIGDYDPKTNPDGTQTRAGFFGGNGNNPIDTSISMQADTTLNTNPAGSFVISPDFDLNLVEMSGLTIDLLNGEAGGTNLSITMLYDTFHTVSPSFLYPGGVPITLPIGEIAGLTQAILTQTELGAGTMAATDNPNIFDITMLISAQLDMDVNISLPGQDPTNPPIDALPIVLPVAGQLEVLGDGTIVMTLGITPDPIAIDIPIEGATLPPIPFELPTFGTETASVIFTSTPNALTIDTTLGLTIVATGTKAGCAVDLNGDGELNFFDVSAFLNAFAAM
ncbi:hypothetical protein COB72_07815, partial [bacterium]